MKALHEPKEYEKLLVRNESWLKARIRDYTTVYNLPDSSAYIRKFSGSIGELIKLLTLFSEPFSKDGSDKNRKRSEEVITGVGQMQFTRKLLKGIPVHSYLFLLKQFRQACYDLFQQAELPDKVVANYCMFAGLSFDRIEFLLLEMQNRDLQKEKKRKTHESPALLRLRKNSYLTIFESLFAPIILLDHANNIINYNESAGLIFPGICKKTALIRKGNSKVPDSMKFIQRQIAAFKAADREEDVFEVEMETPNGLCYYKILLKKLLDLSRNEEIILMFQDLTEQHATEKYLEEARIHAEEADRMKTSFLANMSHEIRTPMNAIVGFTELMLSENYKVSEQKDFLKLIQNSSRDLLHIIEDIIDVAKLESKQLKIRYKPCEIYHTFCDLKVVFTDALRRYGIQDDVSLQLEVSEQDRDIVLNTDGERLKQVLTNLMSNAVKFTNKGYIRFGYQRTDRSGLLLFVKDSGSGIPENMKDQVFDRFFQLEEHQSKNLGGAGLGLAICKNIVSLLGGRMWLESAVNKGSSFYFQIPCHEVAIKQTRSKADSNKPQDFPDLKAKTIVVAEDDEINYLFMEETLMRTGASIIRAENGLEAIDLAESRDDIDMILMDMKMPEVSGFEAAKYIHSIRPEIPIIAHTAFAMEGDKQKVLDAGCSAYLTKPVDRHKLFLLIERYVQSTEKMKKNMVGAK
ncbi:MAG: response regulator [Bacteroidales bacterium]|nr:response regulator [Bacteroidales bacterium]